MAKKIIFQLERGDELAQLYFALLSYQDYPILTIYPEQAFSIADNSEDLTGARCFAAALTRKRDTIGERFVPVRVTI